MKVLIYGSKGWIGSQFINLLQEKNINFTKGVSRVDNEKELLKEIENINPSHIISFIGRTHGEGINTIDYLEQKDKLKINIRDNLYSPFVLSQICFLKNIHYTYLGTGCIFNGEDLKEDSNPNFFGSSYSVVKGFTDRIMHFFEKTTLNLRIRMPITSSYNSRNFITKITSYEKICSMQNSMTVLDELLPYIINMMENNITGTYNFTNPGTISHNEILEMYKELVDPKFTYQNFTLEEQNKILKSERSNNELNTTKLSTLYPEIKDIKTSVRECLMKYKLPNNLLITGGCGFIGSNYINHIFDKNIFDNIINIDALYYCGNRDNVNKNIQHLPKYIFIEGNITNRELIREILKKYNITNIIHFAAQSHVTNSFEESLKYTNDNIYGTHILIEECRKWNKIKKFIHFSTDEVYGDKMEDKQIEQNLLCPTNPYAATKAGAELLVQSYYHSFNLPIIIIRCNNVYGKNQYKEKLIPNFINKLKNNKKIQIEGSGLQTRSFVHIEDVCKAINLILYNGKIGEIYNIGSDKEYSILEVANILLGFFKLSREYIEFAEDRPYNDKRYYINCEKLKKLGWKIKKDFVESLKELCEISV